MHNKATHRRRQNRKRGRILASWPRTLDAYSLLTAIVPTLLDLLDLFCERKNVRLGVNGIPADGSDNNNSNIFYERLRTTKWRQMHLNID